MAGGQTRRTVSLSAPMYIALELYAARTGMPMCKIIEMMLKELLHSEGIQLPDAEESRAIIRQRNGYSPRHA
jgi:hypothetical protein